MTYSVFFTESGQRSLNKLDEPVKDMILAWIIKNLEGSTNPTSIGLALKGHLKGFWRYRIGKYRIIAEINKQELIILVIEVGHRKNIYLR
jgi:mRNA interferase RelE/StbE